MNSYRVSIVVLVVTAGISVRGLSQDHVDHSPSTSSASASKTAPPTVFLDKSPRIVEYQLKRLDNQRLLQVERAIDDTKYIPVYQAILGRVGMSPQFREEALAALSKLQSRGVVSTLLETIGKVDTGDRDGARLAEQLAGMLLNEPGENLLAHIDSLEKATSDKHALLRSVAFAALVMAGDVDRVTLLLNRSDESRLAFLNGLPLIPDLKKRESSRDPIVELLQSTSDDSIRNAAIRAIGFLNQNSAENFQLLAPWFQHDGFRDETVRTLLKIPSDQRDRNVSTELLGSLVEHAENTPAEDRTSDVFIDAMQLADQLLAFVPTEQAKAYRRRLDAVSVRVIRIRTVEEEMRYDLPYFAVQAGKSVQIVLENHDLMPHNLVVTVPGALKEVAQLGLEAGPTGGWRGLSYVPESDKVLHATEMVPAHQQTRLTFEAPLEPGEYPYVCTFPQHWYRMYGVMVVVDDLDAWLKHPVEPANPLGSNRTFVQTWTVQDLQGDLDLGLQGRTVEIGKRIFVEASCGGCHKMHGEGGVIGPDLSDVFSRWKGDRVGILREILDPSHKVDEKYVMQRILTVDGQTLTGVLVGETENFIQLVSSPEVKEPLTVAKTDIEAMVPSPLSMMPKALLDQYTKDEVFELLAYLESARVPSP